jgi:signal transduction histidine kinase/CheY-like chemotaxis protein
LDVSAAVVALNPVVTLVWRRDDGWRMTTATPNVEELTGYAAGDFLSGDIEWSSIIEEQDNPALYEKVGIATAGDATRIDLEYRINRRDGVTRRVHDRTHILRDPSGEPLAFISYVLEAAHGGGEGPAREFIAHMSHEVRTPLSGMLGLIEALGQTRLGPQQQDILGSLREAGATLMQLVNNVLDLSKIEAGAMELDIGDFRLGELCTAAEKLFSRRAAANGVRLATRGQAMDIALRGDAGRIRQVLYNLVSNAVKFTAVGEIEILWSLAPPQPDGRVRARVSVRDTGAGMTPEVLARVFDSYRQADASVAAQYGGTGLGLSISRQLAAMMGGRLWADSEAGVGSTFHFEAIFEASSVARPDIVALEREEQNAAARARIAAARPRVLVAEDAVANQRVIALLLEPLGAEVLIARDGREAVEMAQRESFDLILMDSRMPRLGGIEATLEIRRAERERGGEATPILALTAETLERTLRAFDDAGANGYLSKPFDPQRLIRAVAGLLPEASQAA